MAPNAFCLWDTVIYLRASHTLLPRAFLEVLQKQAEWDWPQKDLNKRMFCTKCMNHEFWFTAVDITSNMTIAPRGYVSEHSCVNFIKSPRVSGFDEWESVQNAELLANVGEEEQERYASVVQVVFLVEHEEKMAKGHGADVRQDGTAGSTVAGSSKAPGTPKKWPSVTPLPTAGTRSALPALAQVWRLTDEAKLKIV